MKPMLRITLMLVLLVVAAASSLSAQDDPAERNKQLYQAVVEQYNAGERGAFYDLLTDPFGMNQGGATLMQTSPDDVSAYDSALAAAMPDIQMSADVVIAEGDWLAATVTYTGTFTEPFSFPPFGPEPVAPNAQAITWAEINFLHFTADGMVDEVWVISDPAILFAQLGIFPPPESSRTGTPVETPAGYQTLSAEALAASFETDMEARNRGVFEDMLALGLAGDSTGFYADPYVSWGFGGPYAVTAAQAAAEGAFPSMLAAAMPDLTMTATLTVTEGDWAATLVTLSGTFSEDVDFFGMPLAATDETITWQFAAIDRFDADGLIVEEWVESDVSPLLAGLGLIPPQ